MDLFGHSLPHPPGRPALVSGGRMWTLDELAASVARRADGIASDTPDVQVVPVATEADADGVVELLAVWAAGLAAAPLSPRLSGPERDRALLTLRAADRTGGLPHGTAAVLWTSGTSGTPRGVALSGEGIAAHARAAAEHLGLEGTDVWLATLSPAHVGGLALLTRALLVGSTLVAEGRFAIPTTLSGLRGELGAPPVSHLSLVPTQLLRLLDAWGDAPPPPSLRCVLMGGAATPAPLLHRALEAGWPLALTYGMTEATSQVATAPPSRVRDKPGSVGRPLPGVEVGIAGDGEILVRGATLAAGVAGSDASLTDAGGWYHTGDLGRVDEEGDLWITGRKSDRMVSGGVTVDPHEVEAVLREHRDIRDACVVGLPDPEWGERVAALLVPEPGAPGELLDEVRSWAADRLGSARLPRVWGSAPFLPLNRNGKVDRIAVAAMLAADTMEP